MKSHEILWNVMKCHEMSKQTNQTKPTKLNLTIRAYQTKPTNQNLPNQTKPNLANQTYQT